MIEAIKAIMAKAKANTALTGRVSNRIYFGETPPKAAPAMPYVVFYAITDGTERCFAAADDYQDATIQASIFDDGPGVATVDLVASDLNLALDRQALTYSDNTHIGCIRVGGTGPEKIEDAWQRTMDFRVTFK